MEYEVRFYYSKNKLNEIITKLDNIKELTNNGRYYEKTIQYDHPSDNISFYSKEIDGRFRIRVTKSIQESKCKISWKKRFNDTTSNLVNKEEEIEVNIDYNDYDNLIYLLDNVLKMKCIESYERYRTLYTNNDIEIAIDEYPFGIALEIENKGIDPIENVKYYVALLELNIEDAYRLSWDDKYTELCIEQNVERYNHVTFDLPMPEVKDI